jgi:hypothetical protein
MRARISYPASIDQHYPNPGLTRFFVVHGERQFQKISTIENTNSSHKKQLQDTEFQRKDTPLFLPTMREDRIAIHARAVNLARRYTAQNENDLMQVCVSRMLPAIAHFFLGFRLSPLTSVITHHFFVDLCRCGPTFLPRSIYVVI